MSVALLACQIILGAALLSGQSQDPLVFRTTRVKIVPFQGQLRAGKVAIRFRQEDWFEKPEEISVSVIMDDSCTATNPDSLRFFTVKNLRKDGFIIRSPRFAADTVKVRGIAVGR